MTPDSVHWLAQWIQHQKAFLKLEEIWLLKQPRTDTVRERFRMITWMRRHLRGMEADIANIRETD